MTQIVSNPSADNKEKIKHAAELIRKSRQRREVFEAVYSGHKHFKTLEEIKSRVTKANNKTGEATTKLVAEDIITRKVGPNHTYLYGGHLFYKANHRAIINLSKNKKKLVNFVTKRNPKISIKGIPAYKFLTKPQTKRLYIDDIDSFSKVKKIPKATFPKINKISERVVNEGICNILNSGSKNDWGGEKNDIFASIKLNGKRISTAFALKGKATQGALTLSKMGKNGDQIPRLFESSADVHIIVYHSQIDERVDDVMQSMAISKSVRNANKKVYFCIIDGRDLSRLLVCYPKEFKLKINH